MDTKTPKKSRNRRNRGNRTRSLLQNKSSTQETQLNPPNEKKPFADFRSTSDTKIFKILRSTANENEATSNNSYQDKVPSGIALSNKRPYLHINYNQFKNSNENVPLSNDVSLFHQKSLYNISPSNSIYSYNSQFANLDKDDEFSENLLSSQSIPLMNTQLQSTSQIVKQDKNLKQPTIKKESSPFEISSANKKGISSASKPGSIAFKSQDEYLSTSSDVSTESIDSDYEFSHIYKNSLTGKSSGKVEFSALAQGSYTLSKDKVKDEESGLVFKNTSESENILPSQPSEPQNTPSLGDIFGSMKDSLKKEHSLNKSSSESLLNFSNSGDTKPNDIPLHNKSDDKSIKDLSPEKCDKESIDKHSTDPSTMLIQKTQLAIDESPKSAKVDRKKKRVFENQFADTFKGNISTKNGNVGKLADSALSDGFTDSDLNRQSLSKKFKFTALRPNVPGIKKANKKKLLSILGYIKPRQYTLHIDKKENSFSRSDSKKEDTSSAQLIDKLLSKLHHNHIKLFKSVNNSLNSAKTTLPGSLNENTNPSLFSKFQAISSAKTEISSDIQVNTTYFDSSQILFSQVNNNDSNQSQNLIPSDLVEDGSNRKIYDAQSISEYSVLNGPLYQSATSHFSSSSKHISSSSFGKNNQNSVLSLDTNLENTFVFPKGNHNSLDALNQKVVEFTGIFT
ncbi:hypothetical protein BB560_001172 [Smittium megazygosporum]|uniref:Uncharacterized protein n=1 Tax=Smittium megazygosporum TaxID=133381 RepID=A0A2T9ZID9_9FUNG|nr:hypothetical protein BB560_001172 [Smittium megazygosporum]